MNFTEMDINKKPKKKKNIILKIILIILIVFTISVGIYILASHKKEKPPKKEKLDVHSRLVQSLYTSVHDFKSPEPYWMYAKENNSIISEMSEGNKLVLTYLNLKASDFIEADEEQCQLLPQNNEYGDLVCSDKTIIMRKDIERSYKEVFGDKATLDVALNIKLDPKQNSSYVYIPEMDSYILYSKLKEKPKMDKNHKYIYDVYKAEKIGTDIKVYESLEVKNKNGESLQFERYCYTFKLGKDNLYSYYSIESVLK